MASEPTSPDLVPSSAHVRSPVALTSIAQLLFSPKAYFSDPRWLQKSPEILFVVWLSGIAFTLGRIDANIMKAELGLTRTGWDSLAIWLNDSWFQFWLFAVGFGVINGFIFWFLGGWWYRKRLNWSGANSLDEELVRPVYMYQDLVASAPAVVVTLVQTLIFASYQDAWSADELWSSSVLIFVLWSCITSYKAATSAFSVSKWKARMWFLALPVLLYIVAWGIIGAFYAQLEDGAV